MKIGVVGTGAVGGYFGGLLKRAGNEVVFFARGTSLEAFQENGLRIESEKESVNVSGTFTDCYQSFSDVDLVLFCVKSTATLEVARYLQPVLKESSIILTLQNGVDNEEILSDVFGRKRILSAATYIQAVVIQPGVVKQIGVPPRLVIGAIENSLKEKADEIASMLNNANIETLTTSNILEIKWKKLLWNVTFNPLTALIESKVGAIFDDQALSSTALKICKEAIAVARCLGIYIDENFYETIFSQGQLARNHQTSMLQDKLKGKSMELESICGYIVEKGREINVETPVLETVYHLLSYQDKVMKP